MSGYERGEARWCELERASWSYRTQHKVWPAAPHRHVLISPPLAVPGSSGSNRNNWAGLQVRTEYIKITCSLSGDTQGWCGVSAGPISSFILRGEEDVNSSCCGYAGSFTDMVVGGCLRTSVFGRVCHQLSFVDGHAWRRVCSGPHASRPGA
ncbi:hypothetical protein Pcinc_028269 [Petrolisthes cinctipes]|uniref:Uncharacterized protein n=1 Tax=Petrolisthes cinctipes TaxID=88211 RepID=A0AAE1K7I5_PETCI|nr:hypothetical protein Pcinc_028269 [Petrolisthes cinctipes]